MQGVSFGSMYAVHVSDPKVMKSTRFNDLRRTASPLIEKDLAKPYNGKRQEYYFHVKEDNNGINDRTFEQIAKVFGLKAKKVNPGDDNAVDAAVSTEKNVRQTKRFIRKAIKSGAPHKIEQGHGIKRITLYNGDKGIFGIYNFDSNTGKILEKLDYIDGKLDSVTQYNDKERIASIAFINQKTSQGVRLNTIA